MEVNELNHKLTTHHFLEDFRDEEEDDEENRFIISLDDIDLKEECSDEFEQNPHGSKNSEKIGKEKQDSVVPVLQRPLSLTESTNLASPQVSDSVSGNKHSLLEVSQDINFVSKASHFDHMKHEKNVKSDHNHKRVQNLKASLTNSTISDTSVNLEACSSGNNDMQKSDERLKSHAAPAQISVVSNEKEHIFERHAACTCIMCYQGRGIIDSNHIPKAVKRKVSSNDYPEIAKKMLSPATSTNVSSSLCSFVEKQISIAATNCTPSYPVSEVYPASESVLKSYSNNSSKNSTSSVLIRDPASTSNYFFVVPTSSGSSDKKSVSASGHQIIPSPLPVMIPKPKVSSGAVVSSVVSNLPSSSIFSLTSLSPSIITTPTTKINTSPSATEKTQVVVVNKSSIENQVADLHNVLNRATKVDLSNPGLVLVHFKPAPNAPARASSFKKLISSSPKIHKSQGNNIGTPPVSELPSADCRENALFGLVKNHLTQPSSWKVLQKLNDISPCPAQSGSSVKHKNASPPKNASKVQYSLLNQRMVQTIQTLQNSHGQNLISLPPPPPLIPRPSCSQNKKIKQAHCDQNHSSIHEEQTETMILPITKNYPERSASNVDIGISKQDERLLSPSLFTFSTAHELSPQEDNELPLTNLYASSSDKSPQVISSGHSQFTNSLENQIPSCTSLISLSSSRHSNVIVKSSSSACLLPCPVTGTIQSVALKEQDTMLMTSSSVRPHMMTQSHPQRNHCNNISDASLFSPMPSALPSDTSSSSSVSIVNGLKLKIRLKDSQLEDKDTTPNQENKSTSKPSLLRTLFEKSTPQSCSTVVSQGPVNATIGKEAHVETAEEMFKRFEDQAMQQVYNAQFGVGEIHRNLRPNRTITTANYDFLYPQSGIGKDSKKKKIDEDKSKPNLDGLANIENTCGINKNLGKVKRKRSLSGEERPKHSSGKSIKLDINQYPKLMQDNSILNRKTIYTPNILAGHKVYVKFNVYSNNQSSRSFLVPFFNIGGSRTQFDVEDMEYINRAVVDFEKEEKSCARHLLYYSREGNKAVFLRKESGLHSNELSSKSYKKNSFILEGYKREKLKQISKPIDEWKVDNQVQIEIDCAEQECEIDLPVNNDVRENCLERKNQAVSPYQVPTASQMLRNSILHGRKISPTASTDFVSKNTHTHTETKSTSYRDRVNILKKRNKLGTNIPSTQVSQSTPEANYNYTETLKKVVLSEIQESDLSCETYHEQTSTSLQNYNPTMQSILPEQQKQAISETLPHIKTEVHDDEYDLALALKQKEPLVSSDMLQISIKSEPIDDYTNCLAESMNISFQNEAPAIRSGETEPHNMCSSDKIKSSSLENVHSSSVVNKSNRIETLTYQTCLPTENVPESASKTLEKGPSPPDENPTDKIHIVKSPTNNSLTSKNHTDKSPTENSPNDNDPCLSNDSDNNEDSSLNPGSSTVSASSDITSSSDMETSQDEEEFISNLSCIKGSANSHSLACESKMDGSTGNNKITSLVESLKQRLTETSSVLPPLLSQTDLKLKKKKKKKRIHKPSNDRDTIVGPTSSIHSTATGNLPKQPSSDFLPKTCDAVNERKDDANLPELPLSLPSVSSLSSLSILQPSPSSLIKSSNNIQKSSVPDEKAATSSTECFKEKNQDGKKIEVNTDERKVLSSSITSKDTSKSNESFAFHSDHLSKETPTEQSKISDVTDRSISISTISATNTQDLRSVQKPKPENSDKECELTEGDKKNNEKTINTHSENFRWPSTGLTQTSSKSSSQDTILPTNSSRNEPRREQVRGDEVQVKQGPESRPTSPSSDIEIDVGTEEFTEESLPVKCMPVPMTSLLSSPPVPNLGRNHIKDFTREHDLMVPFMSVIASTKSSPKKNVPQRAKKLLELSSNFPSSCKNVEIVKNMTIEETPRDKASHDNSNGDMKPSIASLLCEKLAIEVEPVIPKVKNVKGSPMLGKTKILPAQEQDQRTSSPGPKSFNRPTLNAIFGVESVAVPLSSSTTKERGKCFKESQKANMDGKPRKRQVAIKGTHSHKVADRSKSKFSGQNKLSRTKSCSPKNSSKSKSLQPMKTSQSQQRRKRQVAVKGTHSHKVVDRIKSKFSGQSKLARTKSCSQKNSSKSKSLQPMKTSRSQQRSKPRDKISRERLIQRQNVNLKNCFRTWRQLSHEEKVKKTQTMFDDQQLCTVPCRVVLQRLEDMHLDANGQPIVHKAKGSNNDSTSSRVNDHDNGHANVNMKKRKKRPISRAQKRKRAPRDKKDIVDYYASMLETLRKKAQLLEEEAVQKEIKKAEEIKSETLEIKFCELESNAANTICHGEVNKNDPGHTGDCSEPNVQNIENETMIDLTTSHSQNLKIEINEMTLNFDAEIPSPCIEQNANSLTNSEKFFSEKITEKTPVQSEVGQIKSVKCKQSEQNLDNVSEDGSKPQVANITEDDKLKSPVLEMENEERTASKPYSSSIVDVSTEKTQSINEASLDNDTDSSDVGCLVIDFGNEHDQKTDDTLTNGFCVEKPSAEEKKTSTEATPLPKDISDLISDSSFRTKDIVLGFENELGADTVFSTLSQADMDDMFLLEDDDTESPIGMIPEEEVEKLLGLDVTGDGEVDNSLNQQKNDIPKCSTIASTSTCSSLSISESQKLHWKPIIEEKPKSVVDNLRHDESTNENQQQEDITATKDIDLSSSNSSPPSHLQVPAKKQQISPSWNRLLGTEALKKMEKSGSEKNCPSSYQSFSKHHNQASMPNVKLKLAGALSRALKLSAEMKRVFSDGNAPEISTEETASFKKDHKELQLQNTPNEKLYEELPESSGAVEDHIINRTLIPPGEFKQTLTAESKLQQNERCHQDLNKFISISSDGKCNDEKGKIVTRRRKRSSRNTLHNASKKKFVPRNQEHHKACPSGSENENASADLMSSIPTETVSYAHHENPVHCADHFSRSSQSSQSHDVQTSSNVSSSTTIVKSKILPFGAKGINLDKLKLKLNPRLSKPSNLSVDSSLGSDHKDHHKTKFLSEGNELKSCETLPVNISKPSDENLEQNSSKTVINTVLPEKLKCNTEPSLITSKLCNILKNIKKPISGSSSKQFVTGDSSIKLQNSSDKSHPSNEGDVSASKNNRRLRSSPRLPQTQNKKEPEKVSSSMLQKSQSDQDKKKGDEEDKGERSFFDCLSDVVLSGAWEES